MTDLPINPEDELISAVADGEATRADDARVSADPRLRARLAEFFAVADAIKGPVPLVDPATRDAQIERALAEAGFAAAPVSAVTQPPAEPPAPEVAAPAAPPPPAPVADLAAARARRNPNRVLFTALSAAAAFVVLAVAGALVLRAVDDGGGDADVVAGPAATADAPEASADSADEGADAGVEQDFADSLEEFDPDEGDDLPASAAGEVEIDVTLPSLGDFENTAELAQVVLTRLEDDPTPSDEDPDEPCRDSIDAEVTLLGRAELDGQDGLVYVEADPGPNRRLWIIEPAASAKDCQDLAPPITL